MREDANRSNAIQKRKHNQYFDQILAQDEMRQQYKTYDRLYNFGKYKLRNPMQYHEEINPHCNR